MSQSRLIIQFRRMHPVHSLSVTHCSSMLGSFPAHFQAMWSIHCEHIEKVACNEKAEVPLSIRICWCHSCPSGQSLPHQWISFNCELLRIKPVSSDKPKAGVLVTAGIQGESVDCEAIIRLIRLSLFWDNNKERDIRQQILRR